MKIKIKTAGAAGAERRRMPTAESSPIVLTIGHSTRTLDEFIGLLKEHAVSRVVDVRTVPRSRHNPQFNKASLPGSLKEVGVGYVHLPGLGGLRGIRSPIRSTQAGGMPPFEVMRITCRHQSLSRASKN